MGKAEPIRLTGPSTAPTRRNRPEGWATVNANQYNSYNTYGVLWTPQTLTFYYDGKAVARTPTPSDFAQKMYMIANVAVGGTWPGFATGENATMKIDYIRAFSNNSSIPAVALQTISSPIETSGQPFASGVDIEFLHIINVTLTVSYLNSSHHVHSPPKSLKDAPLP